MASEGPTDGRQPPYRSGNTGSNGAFGSIASGRGSPSRGAKPVQLHDGGAGGRDALSAQLDLRRQRDHATAASGAAAAGDWDSESGTGVPAPARTARPVDRPAGPSAMQPPAVHGKDGIRQQPRSRLSNDGGPPGGGSSGGPGNMPPPADGDSAVPHGRSHTGASDGPHSSSAAASPMPPLQQQHSPRDHLSLGGRGVMDIPQVFTHA